MSSPPAVTPTTVLNGWGSGLSSGEVDARRAQGQGNIVPPAATRSYAQIVYENAFTFINTMLYVVSLALMLMRLYGDALVTAGLILLNVAIAVFQEVRAKRVLDRIVLLAKPRATVIRDDREQAIDPVGIVLGDLVVIRPGDQIVVDGEMIGDGAVEVDESLLTGEAEPVAKHAGDRFLSGSFCVSGQAAYEVRVVGTESYAQQITRGARAFRRVKTPLQRDLDLIIRVMVLAVALIGSPVLIDLVMRLLASITRLAGDTGISSIFDDAYRGYPVKEVVKQAAVVVALVPQGLITMVTITYAAAQLRLAGKGALIQQTNAIESLAHVDVLCLDKTGTLTSNRLRVVGLRPFGIDEGECSRLIGEYVAASPDRNRTAAALEDAYPGQVRPTRATVPFSSSRKWGALIFADDDSNSCYVLGAPDVLAPSLHGGAVPDGAETGWVEQGLRLLLFARGSNVVSLTDADDRPNLPGNLEPLALIAMADELRPEARDTLRRFAEADVRIKVISGDDPRTVSGLARQADFPEEIRLVSGLDLDNLSDDAFAKVVNEGSIFGRITPRQKERIVRSLAAEGHYVAMIGDGVNDVLALKQANLGISMRSGSAATRGVADLVLLNDSFAVLPAGFREGQRILGGMRDIVSLFLTRSLYLIAVILSVSLVGAAFPITPRHNALLAFLTVGVPTFALAAWARPTQQTGRMLRSIARFVLPAALTVIPLAVATYLYMLEYTNDLRQAQTALTTVSICCGLGLLLFVEPPNDWWVGGDEFSGDRRPAWLAGVLLAAYAVMLAVPSLRDAFELSPIKLWFIPIVVIAVTLWTLTLRWMWRADLLRRFFDLDSAS